MIKKEKIRQGIYTVSFMFVITLIFISALAFANLNTREQIAINRKLATQKAILKAAGIAIPSDNVNEIYNQNILAKPNETTPKYYEIVNPDKSIKGFVIKNSGGGLWGEIETVIGLQTDKATIIGFDILKQAETPGLGARIEEDWFKNQLSGKKGEFTTIIDEKATPAEGEIQGVTGATITVDAVRKIINESLKKAAQISGTEAQGGNDAK